MGSCLSCGHVAVYTNPFIPLPPTRLSSRPSRRFLLSFFPIYVCFPFPLLFLAVLRFLLSISPRLCLHRAIRSEHFLFTFCTSLKWRVPTTCGYPCEIIDHSELQSDSTSQEMPFGDGFGNLWAQTARLFVKAVAQFKCTFRQRFSLPDTDWCSLLHFCKSRSS